jgi:GH24 family phage-related lysozyme (muramidase)
MADTITAGDVIIDVQKALRMPEDKRAKKIGPLTRGSFEHLANLGVSQEYRYPYEIKEDDDIPRQINADAVELIQHFESCYLRAYQDEVGVWTIGWGHTGLQHKDGTVYRGRTITQAKADELFRYDMHQFEQRVESLAKVFLPDHAFGALVAFDFNTGGLHRSTLLTKLNANDIMGAANEFPKWTRAGGKVLNGLVRRRRSERRLFLNKKPYILRDMREVQLDIDNAI